MTENKRYIDNGFEAIDEQSFTDTETNETYYVEYFDEIVDLLNEQDTEIQRIYSTLDNRILKLQESLDSLKEMDMSDLNPQAVEDVGVVLSISINALKEFKKELNAD